MPQFNFSDEEVGDLLDALDRAADDFGYAATFPDNGYDPEDVALTLAAWQALTERLRGAT